MTFDLGLSGRRALVTAGTRGVGAAVVEVLFGRAGAWRWFTPTRHPCGHAEPGLR